MFGFEAADFVKGRVGHDRRTAGAVGADDDGLGVAVVIGGFHAIAQDLDFGRRCRCRFRRSDR